MCADMHTGACAKVRRGAQRCAEVRRAGRGAQKFAETVVTLRATFMATLGERHGMKSRPHMVQNRAPRCMQLALHLDAGAQHSAVHLGALHLRCTAMAVHLGAGAPEKGVHRTCT